MAKKLHLVHVKSNVLDKAPSASTINYGEIAVNYNADSPALYIRDDDDNIVKFISEPYFEKIVGTGVTENDGETFTPLSEIIQQDEETIAAAFNDLNERKADKSYVDEAVSSITIDVDTELDSGSTNPVENRAIYQVIIDNEEVTAAALNDLEERKADKSYVDEAISASTMQVDDQLDSASTNPLENRVIYQILEEDEEAIAAAINDLNDRLDNISFDLDDHLDSGSTNAVMNSAITMAILEDEEAIAGALNDLNERKADKDYVDELVSSITIDVDSEIVSGSTNPVENQAIYNALRQNEMVMAASLNNLNSRIIISGVTENGSGNVVTSTTLYRKELKVNYGNLTAGDVGALSTGATLDNVSDGTTRKLSDYATVANFNSHTGDTTAHVTAANKTQWNNAITGVTVNSSPATVTDHVASLNIPDNAYLLRYDSLSASAFTEAIEALSAGTPVFYYSPYDSTDLDSIGYCLQLVGASDTQIVFGPQFFPGMDTFTMYHVISNTGSHSLITKEYIETDRIIQDPASATSYNILSADAVNTALNSLATLPTVTSSDNGKILRVVNGTWALVDPATIYSGSGTPQQSLGNDGDIYLQTS